MYDFLLNLLVLKVKIILYKCLLFFLFIIVIWCFFILVIFYFLFKNFCKIMIVVILLIICFCFLWFILVEMSRCFVVIVDKCLFYIIMFNCNSFCRFFVNCWYVLLCGLIVLFIFLGKFIIILFILYCFINLEIWLKLKWFCFLLILIVFNFCVV